jgi:S1-C subfamily serine protease
MSPDQPSPEALSPALPDAVARVARSVVGVVSRRGFGAAGCVWRDGVIVAPARIAWRAERLRVVLPANGDNAEAVLAKVKGADHGTDLAVLALEADATAPPPLDRSDRAERRAGEFVFAVARDASGLASASFGHIGAVGGAWRSWRGGAIDALIRLDGGLYPGFAGAPVADAAGHAIGIATDALSRLHGIVLPASTVDRVVEQLLAHGRVSRGYLGLALQPVRLGEAQAAALGVAPGQALLVTSVAEGGPAANAGVLLGDTLVMLGDTRIESMHDLGRLLGTTTVGTRLNAVLLRAGQRHEASIEIGERAPPRACC